jgi:hypothetical protein
MRNTVTAKPNMQASIIGSFRKYYSDVKRIVLLFNQSGVNVLSPRMSFVINPNDEFVFLNSDNPKYDSIEIQLIALHRILMSDFVYVFTSNGYIGRTTCYEIGRVIERAIPIYYNSIPKDLPIFIPEGSIIEPDELALTIRETGRLPEINEDCDVFKYNLTKSLREGLYYDDWDTEK